MSRPKLGLLLGILVISSILFGTNLIQPASAVGTIGPFQPRTNYPVTVGAQSCIVDLAFVYCIAGANNGIPTTSAVYFARLSYSGTVGAWTSTTNYPISVRFLSCVAYSGFAYCIGGQGATSQTNAVYYAPLSPSGGVGTWTATTNYPSNISNSSCVTSSGFVYCIGGAVGNTATNATYFASLSPNGVGAWSSTTMYPLSSIQNHSCIENFGYVFCFAGDQGTTPTDAVYFARLSSTGIGAWTATVRYFGPADQLSCTSLASKVYCVGGNFNGSPTYAVFFAALTTSNQAGGIGIGYWDSSGYPTLIDQESCVSVQDMSFIWCIGGETKHSTNFDMFTNAVYSGITDPPTSSLYAATQGTSGSSYYDTFISASVSRGTFTWGGFYGSLASMGASLCTAAPGNFELVVRNPDNAISHIRLLPGSWPTAWNSPGGLTMMSPTCSVAGSTLYVAVTGTDNGVYVTSMALPNGTWAPWTGLGGITAVPPSIAATPATATTPARVDVVVQGLDHGVYHKTSINSGAWSATWDKAAGGIITDSPVALSDGDGVAIIVKGALETGNYYSVWYNKYSFGLNSWTSWTFLGYTLSTPSATRDSSGTIHVVARELDNSVKHKARPLGGTFPATWDNLGGDDAGRPAIAVTSDLVVILVRRSDNSFYSNISQDAGITWLGWNSAFGSFASDPILPLPVYQQ